MSLINERTSARNRISALAEHPTPIRAELSGDRRCSAIGITATGNAPVLALCRRLIEAGHDPAARLEAYRGTTLCLRVRSIGEGARLTVREGTSDGRPRFVKLTGDPADMKGRRNVEVGPPIAPNDLAATPLAEPLPKTPGAERADEALRQPEQGIAPEEMATMDAVAALDEGRG
jgi:hypothetical protein